MEDGNLEDQPIFWWQHLIFSTQHQRIGVHDAPHIWGIGEIRDAGERRLFGGLGRSEPFVTPHIWGTGEMSTEISATYLGCWGNKHSKSRHIYVALGHDELNKINPNRKWCQFWRLSSYTIKKNFWSLWQNSSHSKFKYKKKYNWIYF